MQAAVDDEDIALSTEEKIIQRRENFRIFALLSPGALWLFLFFFVPMFVLLLITFKTFADAHMVDVFTWNNYARIFTEPLYAKVFLRSLWVAILVTIVSILLGYPVAHFIARKTKKHREILFLALIIPFWTSIVIRTYAWKILLGTSGFMNYLLKEMGLINAPLHLLYSQTAVIVGLLHVFLPFMIMPLFASLEKLDHSVEEAAMDLGANRVKTFLRVTLPLTLPGLAMGSLLVFILSLGSFLTPALLGGTESLMISNIILEEFRTSGNWPFGGALSVVFLIISLVFVVIYNRLFQFEE